MTNEEQRQLLDLQYLHSSLMEKGRSGRLMEKSEEFPLSFILLPLMQDDGAVDGGKTLQLIYIPSAQTLEETNLLQYYAQLSEAPLRRGEELNQLLEYLNLRTPLGHFGVDHQGGAYYRYVLSLPRFSPPSGDLVIETIELFERTLQFFGGLISAVESGDMTFADAASKLG